MGKKSPDVKGAAGKEAAASEAVARMTTYADRPDQYTPWGSTTWETERVIDPATGKAVTRWNQNQQLSPEMQALFDQQMGGFLSSGDAAAAARDRAIANMSAGPDWAQFGEAQGMEFSPDQMRQRAEDMAYQRETMRLDPQFQADQESLELKLRNQGLVPGDAAYDSAMSNFYQGRNDAYERARLGAAQQGRAEVEGMWGRETEANQMANALRDKQIQEYIQKRQFGLSEADALGGTDQFTKAAQSAAATGG